MSSAGTFHDSPMFETLVGTVINNGFTLTTLLADAGYSSKNNYLFCNDNGIRDVYIDFPKHVTGKKPKSDLWRKKFEQFKNNHASWKEIYRYRSIVENVFSSIKMKNLNYLRSRNIIAQDNELLLKALNHNLTILGRYFHA